MGDDAGATGEPVRRVRGILDAEEQERAAHAADVQGAIKAIATVAGVGVDLAIGAPVSTLGGVLAGFYLRRKKPLVEARLNATLRGLERRLEDFGDRLDAEFVTKDEFLEMADEVFERVARERDERKRDLYSLMLANNAQIGVDRSFYPTALKLLDALAPVHVDILRELRRRKPPGGQIGGKESGDVVDIRDIVFALNLGALEELRKGDLSADVPEFFGEELKGIAAWDEALGKVASYSKESVRELLDLVSAWNGEFLEHIWYLGKEGLVHQIGERGTNINKLGDRLLQWLSEPED